MTTDKVQVEFLENLYPYEKGDIAYIPKHIAEYNEASGGVRVIKEQKQNKMIESTNPKVSTKTK